jgi:hypothetical protein
MRYCSCWSIWATSRSLWTVSEINRDGGRVSKAAYALVSVSSEVSFSSLTVALGLDAAA